MNAVNLIPRERRDRRFAVSMSPQTIALLAGLGAALVAVVLYVSAANGVTSRQNELTRLTASTAQAQAVSASLTANVTAVQQLSSQVATVRQLAGGRYPWPRLLDQIGRLMPAGTALTSLQSGGAPGTTGTAGTAGATGTATGSTGSGTGAGASAPTTLQLAGCATSQSTVAQTMQWLRGVTGVSDVQLASSTENSASGPSSGTSTAGTASAACGYPVQFQMSLIFGTPSGATATSTTGVKP